MKLEAQLEAAVRVPRWSTPFEARERLDQEIDRFVKAAAEATAEPDTNGIIR